MPSTYLNIPGKEMTDGIAVSKEGMVKRVNSQRYGKLSGVHAGMKLLSIDGAPVSDPQEEWRRLANYEAEVLAVFSSPEKDEFDISSDEDEESTFSPSTFLPQHSAASKTQEESSCNIVLDAASRCTPGRCIIIMSEGSNPALPIAQAAEKAQASFMYIDTVARMKTRQKISDAGEVFKKSLQKGLWIFLERATKSITLLRKLGEIIEEVEKQGTMHKQARVFLMCEPHPHFPEVLLRNSITLRCRLQGTKIEVNQPDELLESNQRLNAIYGNNMSVPNESPSSGKETRVSHAKKRVTISAEVDIVHLEKNTFLELSASAQPPAELAAGEGINRVAKYSFGSNEKFISLCKIKEGRFAVGTNTGYVVLLDSDGLPLIQFRPHKACVWDLAFSTPFDFCTACEDGTSSIFNYSLAGREVTATSVASFQSDVFAVTYTNRSDPCSPVLSGGLSATICVLHSDRQNSTFISCGASIQALCGTRNHLVVMGGGSGTCSLIDPLRCTLIANTNRHTRKVPAVASQGDVTVTGGFDKMIRVWDINGGSFQLVHEQSTSEVVTAVATNGKLIAACSGSNLSVWDVRRMATPLATKTNAWRDLTRGLIIDDSLIVTASVDGIARFWQVN